MLLALNEPCLVDVDAADDRTSIASNLTIRRRDFRANVVERDGTCVLTGEIAEFCTACHILPHSKGSNVCPYRSSTTVVTFGLKNQVYLERRQSPWWTRC